MFTLHLIGKYRTLLNSKQPKATVVKKKERKKKYDRSYFDDNLFDSLEDSLENIR